MPAEIDTFLTFYFPVTAQSTMCDVDLFPSWILSSIICFLELQVVKNHPNIGRMRCYDNGIDSSHIT